MWSGAVAVKLGTALETGGLRGLYQRLLLRIMRMKGVHSLVDRYVKELDWRLATSLLRHEYRDELTRNLCVRDRVHEFPDLARVIPGCWTVAQLAILCAMYMGCSPIYLLGMDHDWLAHRGNDRHFYGTGTFNNHPTISEDLSSESYRSMMERYSKLWLGYEQIQKFAAPHDLQILNATDGGFLDVFERVNYNTIFESRMSAITF